jgi:hypothetical protein
MIRGSKKMKNQPRYAFIAGCLLSIILLTAGAGLVSAGESGFSVGQDAYDVGKVDLSKIDAYIGDPITLTGSGQLPNANLEIFMGGVYEGDNQLYLAILGETTSDSSGNWTFTFTVPTTCTRESDDATVDIFPAYWPVGGVTQGPDTGIYASMAEPDLLVYGTQPASTPTGTEASSYSSGTYSSATLPATGSSTTLIGIGLMVTGTLCFCTSRMVYSRRKVDASRERC